MLLFMRLRNIFPVVFLLSVHCYLLFRIGAVDIIFLGSIKLLDFDNYYRIIHEMLNGSHPYRLSGAQTLGPPLVLAVYLPFSFLPLTAARSLITILNLTSAYFSSFILVKNIYNKQVIFRTLLLSLLLLSLFPARYNLLMGQPNLIAVFLLTILLIAKNSYLKGLCLVLSVSIKTFLGFAFLPFVKKDKQALLVFIIGFFMVIGLSFILIKPAYYMDYFAEKFSRITFAPVNLDNTDYYNQSIKSAMARFGIGESYRVVYPLLLTISGVYLLVSGNIEAGVVLSVLLSPVVWQYYFVMLFPVMAMVFKKLSGIKKLILAFAYLLIWIEMPWLHKAPLNFINSVLASHYFIGGIILLYLIVSQANASQK